MRGLIAGTGLRRAPRSGSRGGFGQPRSSSPRDRPRFGVLQVGSDQLLAGIRVEWIPAGEDATLWHLHRDLHVAYSDCHKRLQLCTFLDTDDAVILAGISGNLEEYASVVRGDSKDESSRSLERIRWSVSARLAMNAS